MNPTTTVIIGFTLYKLAGLAAGMISCWLGYKLFVGGLWNGSGDVTTKFGEFSLVIKSAAPGTFFAIVGALISVTVVYKGFDAKTLGNAVDVSSGIVAPSASDGRGADDGGPTVKLP